MARFVRPTVADRLAAAGRLLDGTVTDAGGLWSRATVWILRIALEQSVDRLWARVSPPMARCSMRAQLLALDRCAGAELAGAVAGLWAVLSRAGHHLDSEPAPTVHELRDWYDETARLVGELDRIGRSDVPAVFGRGR
ncbi:hypothetical protein [Nocardia veterana]|uniref:Uncharacterized protein n=1 Tax=Nocardia veterana TaxID=132249 RepID=A0A7X6RHE4_9NOCA|nr:hypothetical protein [Nocardia veterana]NKY86001.1 hypothetical protein [Nocardia veterana]